MSRKAILIEASAVEGQDPLPGASRDVESLRRWLTSNAGGAWEDEEIITLNTPPENLVRAWLAVARLYNFAFVAFSGHGDHPFGGDFDDTEILLADGPMRVRDLNCGADRCSVVVDACRYVAPEIFGESFRQVTGALKYARDVSRRQHRDLFDAAVATADKGVVYQFSCDVGEFAGESRLTGGYFTRCLVESANFWYAGGSDRLYLDTRLAHQLASEAVTRRAPQQHPQYEGGRRIRHPPFAVRA